MAYRCSGRIDRLMTVATLLQKTVALLLAVAVAAPPAIHGNCCCWAKAQQRRTCCEPKERADKAAKACCQRRTAAIDDARERDDPEIGALQQTCRCAIGANERSVSIVRPRLKSGDDSLTAVCVIPPSVQSADFREEVEAIGQRTDHRPLQLILCVWIV